MTKAPMVMLGQATETTPRAMANTPRQSREVERDIETPSLGEYGQRRKHGLRLESPNFVVSATATGSAVT
jgi:hypothetical protein